MSDLLAAMMLHELVLERYVGRGQYPGDAEYDDPEVLACYVDDGIRVIGTPEGEQIVSTARAALPATVGPVPLQSRVTLPPEFGNRVTTVVTCAVGNGGGLPTPDHVEIGVK